MSWQDIPWLQIYISAIMSIHKSRCAHISSPKRFKGRHPPWHHSVYRRVVLSSYPLLSRSGHPVLKADWSWAMWLHDLGQCVFIWQAGDLRWAEVVKGVKPAHETSLCSSLWVVLLPGTNLTRTQGRFTHCWEGECVSRLITESLCKLSLRLIIYVLA